MYCLTVKWLKYIIKMFIDLIWFLMKKFFVFMFFSFSPVMCFSSQDEKFIEQHCDKNVHLSLASMENRTKGICVPQKKKNVPEFRKIVPEFRGLDEYLNKVFSSEKSKKVDYKLRKKDRRGC